MKKLLLFIFVLGLSVSFAQTLYLNENFDYGSTANADITAATTKWERYSGTVGPTYVVPGLTYAGYPSSGIGGGAGMTFGSSGTNDGDARVALSPIISSSSTIYFSFLVNITAAKSTADYFIHLSRSLTSSTIYRGRPYVIANGSGYSINFSKAGETAAAVGTKVLEFNKTYLLVIKYVFSTAALDDDVTTLYIYDSGVPASEPGSPLEKLGPVGAGTANDPPDDLGFVALRQGSNGMTGTVDGIRVSDNWGLALTGVATAVEENGSDLPSVFELSQNYPNPFNPSTVIKYQVAQNTFVNINVYDVLGNQIANLVREEKAAGSYELKFNAINIPSGIYFYTIQAGNFAQTRKMILIK